MGAVVTRTTTGTVAVGGWITYEDPGGAERERLEDVGAAADTSVEEHRETSLGGHDHLLEGADGGRHVVELAGAVVGHDDARRAGVYGQPSCVSTEMTIYQGFACQPSTSMFARFTAGRV